MSPRAHTRRIVLTTGTAALGATALTACGGSESASDGGAPAQSAPPAAGTPLTALADIEVGSAAKVTGPDDEEIIVTRTAEATAVAFSAVCTHQGCKVMPEGAELRCPCHGSVFDAVTGQARTGPASEPLPPVEVSVRDGQVVTG